ncbi:Cof-type HAD-IIB family hydrolase [Vibrio sp. JC009]|uniref:Cof-type HAD-IIB family hydrolase n=1 Tax=Vibrio sp. JC009 TaxID=2912314 RepID=UPI0023AE7C55|nr:Cof-type HAD-IIB family hydrolase [Vibrio sp. JC009]WED24133.1 Cof-type HAD-IIB family hydrolase [Vibrio sp. JC009]
MYQVLALDLDGTVLNSEHGIHPEVKAAIREAKEVCHVVLVTGRHHTAAKPYYEELGLDTPAICCNGTYVYDYHNHKVLSENSIAKENARKFLELANEHQMKAVLYVTHSMLYSRSQPIDYMHALEKWACGFEGEKKPDIRKIDCFEKEINDAEYIWKFVIEGEPESIARIEELDFVKQNFSGERSWSNRVDFANKGNAKGTRLAEYLDQNGFKPEQVMAVGDNHNDISMIQLAGLGVAMQNADDKVKQAADIVCETDNNTGGLARLIRTNIRGLNND